MKTLNFLIYLSLFCFLFSCDDEEVLPQLDAVAAPSALSLDFTPTTDNSGTVNIRPNGTGATLYRILFGDGTTEAVEVEPGGAVDHVYPEGTYTVSMDAVGINGKVTSHSQELTVSFLPPENLVVTIAETAGNPLSIDVSATADLETSFTVNFGEDPAADPVSFQEGEIVQHAYQTVGTYQVIVMALSGGTQSISDTQTVTISNPLLLPIDFESTTLDYSFTNFGGATASVVDNPDQNDANNSNKVGQLNKQEGSEVWAGAFLSLGAPIDFSSFQKIRIKTWSPTAGIPVLLKLENATDGNLFVESTVNTSVANGWEELIFDFSSVDQTQQYQKVVLFFDFGTAGSGANYYFDDIELTDGSGTIELPLDFEASDLVFNFTGFGGATAEIIDNPDASGINTSTKVGSSVKETGSQTWAGAFIDLPEAIDFSNNQTLNLKVWPAMAGATVMVKVENPDNTDTAIEIMATTTVAQQWETLSFNFDGIDTNNGYSRVVFFFDFGNEGTGENYYFDDLEFAQ